MNAMMDACFEVTSETNKEKRCWTCLRNEWRDELDFFVKKDVAPQMERINVFSKHTVELNNLLTKLFVDKKETVVRYDKGQLAIAQNVLKRMHPTVEQEIDGIVDGNFINFANLFKVFSFMLPDTMNKLETFKYRDAEAIEFEYNEVEQLDTKASKLQDECNGYNTLLKQLTKKEEKRFRKFCQKNTNLPFCLLQTPPVTRRCEISRMRNRLGLINDLISHGKLFKEPKTASKNANLSKTSSCTSLSNYKSQDAALQLLSKPKSRANTSKSIHNMSALSKFSTPKFSSTMCSTATKGMKNHQTDLKFSPSMMTPNGISAVRKVAANSVFHLNQPIIRSPTGRFQALDVPRNLAALTKAVIYDNTSQH